jgi:hypothetical protein
MAKEDLSWIKKPRTDYSKEETRLLASNPQGAQDFISSTRDYGGATMSLSTGKMIRPGDKAYIVGKETSEKTKQPVSTAFENPGQSHPGLSAKQFSSHFVRLKSETKNPRAAMGTWVDEEAKNKGVQIDLSAAYKTRSSAEKKMVERNEDAIWDMGKMKNIRNEEIRGKYTKDPRPKKDN